MINGPEYLSHEGRLRELELFRQKKRGVRENLINVYLMGGNEDETRLLPVVPTGKTRGNGQK